MTLDHETRTVLFEKLKLTKEDIDKYEKGTLSLSGYDEYKLRSGKLSRKISRELTESVSPLLDRCDIFDANKHMLEIAHEIGEQHRKRNLTSDDDIDLMAKLQEYNTSGRLICECKNVISRTR
jgi:predicted nucleic acid-binding protein